MHIAYLGIGTNLGNKPENIRTCLQLIEKNAGHIAQVSSVYETEPWGVDSQDSYQNLVVGIHTFLFPFALLRKIQKIEHEMGRVRIEKWGSRVIDIDILFFENYRIKTDHLILPHPFIAQRNFVLHPLEEIAANFVHPVVRKTIQEIKTMSEDSGWIRKLT